MKNDDRLSRQSFLGVNSEKQLADARIALVGCGGGGSHAAQQFAHVGIGAFELFDADRIENSNLNRLVTATERDVNEKTLKVEILARTIRGVNHKAEVNEHACRWQDAAEYLHRSDLIIGCVDGLIEREQLERAARRHLIPYIDIGLGVHAVPGAPPRMAGQIIVSMPGSYCMRCIGFINEQELAEEAAGYGDAGPRPQVVWANAVLASTAVGIAVDLLTGWTGKPPPFHLSYDANAGTVTVLPRWQYVQLPACTHYPLNAVGEPVWL